MSMQAQKEHTLTKNTRKTPSDQVCNSYLDSYANFSKEAVKKSDAAAETLRRSKKGKITQTLAALEALSPAAKQTMPNRIRVRPESPVRRGIGDMGQGSFGRTMNN